MKLFSLALVAAAVALFFMLRLGETTEHEQAPRFIAESIRDIALSGTESGAAADSISTHSFLSSENAQVIDGSEANAIFGRVLDRSGNPIAGARIDLHSDPLRGENIFVETPCLRSATSGLSGQFSFAELLKFETYRLRIEHDDYVVAHVRPVGTIHPQSLRPVVRLREGSTLTGDVVDAAGAPLPNAVINILSIEAPGIPPLVHRERQLNADDGGQFEALHLSPGPKRIVASLPGYATAYADNVRVSKEGRSRPVRLQLVNGRSISGIVKDDLGQPVAGVPLVARISGHWQGTDADANSSETKSTTASPVTDASDVSEPVAKGTIKRIDPAMSIPQPLPDGRMSFVMAWPKEIVDRAFLEVSAISGADGRFDLRGLTKAAYLISVDSPFHSTDHEWIAQAGARNIELSVSRLPTVSGRVRGEGDSEFITSFSVATSSSQDPALVPLEQRITVSDQEGRFGPLPARRGTQYIHVWANDHIPGISNAIQLDNGEQADEQLVLLARGGILKGYVRGPNNEAISGAVITLQEERPPVARGKEFLVALAKAGTGPLSSHRATTDEDGFYSLSAVPAGRLRLRVIHERYAETLSAVFVSPGEGSLELPNVFLRPGAVVSGRIRGGTQGQSRRVVIAGLGADPALRVIDADSGGEFTCAGLPAGNYRVFSVAGLRPNPDQFLKDLSSGTMVTVAEGQQVPSLAIGDEPPPVTAVHVKDKKSE